MKKLLLILVLCLISSVVWAAKYNFGKLNIPKIQFEKNESQREEWREVERHHVDPETCNHVFKYNGSFPGRHGRKTCLYKCVKCKSRLEQLEWADQECSKKPRCGG